MKFATFIVFSVLGVIGVSTENLNLPQEIVDLLKGVSATCKDETGIPQSFIDEMRQAKVPDDPKAKCYIKCVMMQLQAMKDDGHLDLELIEASLPDIIKAHGGVETVHKCKHIHEPDLCETAYKLVVCFKKENPQVAAMFE